MAVAQITAAAVELTPLDLVLAAALLLVAGVVSVLLRLGIERQLLVAGVRTVAQLLLVGYVLRFVFEQASGFILLGVVTLMLALAAWSAVQRPARTFRGAWLGAFTTLTIGGLTTTLFATAVIIDVERWYEPQYLIPLLGMVLGNGLTGISLCLDHLLEQLTNRRDEIEMELAHGATSWEAAREHVAAAVRRGMIPVVNSMMVVGVVSLPGMMTGQILAGADPLQAVKYQIVIMFMIAAGTAVGATLITLFAYRRIFTREHRLALERLIEHEKRDK